MSERRGRALAAAAGKPLLSADLGTVTWLTGIATDIEVGPSPFTAPPLVVLDPDGSITAVASEDEAPGVARGVEAATFPGFAVEDVDRASLARDIVLDAIGGARELAVELDSLPGDLVVALAERGVALTDVRERLRAARAIKDPDEVEAIRAAISISDAGQAAAREAATAGATELAIWASVRSSMEEAAGGRIPVLADLVSGERTAEVGGPPTQRRLEAGDLVLVDLVPRLGAYWADSCATVSVGEPAEVARDAHAASVAALEEAVELCRPGARAGEVDARARQVIETAGGSYPHHTGHGIGVTFHEEPRVIPESDRILEEGMVVALEPGMYGQGFGVRVEQVVLVTASGAEILSGHDVSL
ncbi:MAG TPA: Xaa-Pro peptidase family protein [Gaiellaceae bacterium]